MADISSIVNPPAHPQQQLNAAARVTEEPSSLMAQVASLSAEKRMLEERLKESSGVLERFQAQERDEMKKKFDTIIQQWINENDWTDPNLKDSVLKGMEEMVKQNKGTSPIWNMVCCASETHKRNVSKLNQIQTEYNDLKSRVEGGSFRSEESRLGGSKRKDPEPPVKDLGGSSSGGSSSYVVGGSGAADPRPVSVWDDFETVLRGGGVSHFVPDPEVIRGLRSEWRPLSEMT
jgi:hypothetical protein